jgi:hypothetical protein
VSLPLGSFSVLTGVSDFLVLCFSLTVKCSSLIETFLVGSTTTEDGLILGIDPLLGIEPSVFC